MNYVCILQTHIDLGIHVLHGSIEPGMISDYRGIHKDKWFRSALRETDHPNCIPSPRIIDNQLPSQIQIIKVWIALNVTPGLSGLIVCPESQERRYPRL